MNNPFDYTPDSECKEAYRELRVRLEAMKRSDRAEDINFCRELEAGKMLGVLIARDDSGVLHKLFAFSGQIGEGGFNHPGFVGPVFDYLQPDGYFKTTEADISRQNMEIEQFERGVLAVIKNEYRCAKDKADAIISDYKERYRLSKLERKAKRESGRVSGEMAAAMIRQSQFEKAELHRLKKKMAGALEPYYSRLQKAESHLSSLKEKRRSDSEALQKWLFSNFRLLNARGESMSLSEIFAKTPLRVPPSGAGECCGPKLLQAAYLHGWHPIGMAEYWYGKSKGGELRIDGEHYPACRGKCLPVLSWMLQGLEITPLPGSGYDTETAFNPEIIFENEWFCVVNKPSGMLSVPGKGVSVSLQEWLSEKYGRERKVRMAHRLDQDTSGLIIATFGDRSYKTMQSLFAMRKVHKTYIADLEGDYKSIGIPRQGRISLPLSPDWLDRPRQRIDHEDGKEAMTDYEFVATKDELSRITFHPLTGRTHQLRVHAASKQGLGMPIAGDRLYGKKSIHYPKRLHLHAHKIEFLFPPDGRNYCFESEVPF